MRRMIKPCLAIAMMICVSSPALAVEKITRYLAKVNGHWLMGEAPDQVVPKIVAFLSAKQE